MSGEVKLLDTVALLEDVQADGVLLKRGEVGAVVEILAPQGHSYKQGLAGITVCVVHQYTNNCMALAEGDRREATGPDRIGVWSCYDRALYGTDQCCVDAFLSIFHKLSNRGPLRPQPARRD